MRTQQGRGHSGAAQLHASHHLISRHSPRSLPATQVRQTRQSPQPSPLRLTSRPPLARLPAPRHSRHIPLPAWATRSSRPLPSWRRPHRLLPHSPTPPIRHHGPLCPTEGRGGWAVWLPPQRGLSRWHAAWLPGAEARPVPHGAHSGVRWQQGKRQSPPRPVPGLALQCGAV